MSSTDTAAAGTAKPTEEWMRRLSEYWTRPWGNGNGSKSGGRPPWPWGDGVMEKTTKYWLSTLKAADIYGRRLTGPEDLSPALRAAAVWPEILLKINHSTMDDWLQLQTTLWERSRNLGRLFEPLTAGTTREPEIRQG